MEKMMLIYILIVTVVGLVWGKTNYCEKFGKAHTMCKYPKNSGCKKLARGLNATHIADILDAHNKLRQKVATGKQSRQSQASNMREMVWNNELAAVAQRWADQCIFNHDEKRSTGAFDHVGQNIAQTFFMTDPKSAKVDFSGEAINMWFSEVDTFDINSIKSYKFDFKTGHYSQLVWAETYAIGCGFSLFRSNTLYSKYYVCNYGPGGNMITASVYETGKPCSKCQSCSKKYPGLCRS